MGKLVDRGDELLEERFSIADNRERFVEVGVVRLLGGVSGTTGASGDEKSIEDMPSEGVCGDSSSTGGGK